MGAFPTIDDDIRALKRRAQLEQEVKQALLARRLRRLGILAEPKPRAASHLGPAIDAAKGTFIH